MIYNVTHRMVILRFNSSTKKREFFFFFLMIRRPPRSPLFPYTTLSQSSGTRVNAVAPGATKPRLMWTNVPAKSIPHMRKILSKEIPLGRLAQPQEPARTVAWLLSEESSYVTGSHFICDGGILAKASISV